MILIYHSIFVKGGGRPQILIFHVSTLNSPPHPPTLTIFTYHIFLKKSSGSNKLNNHVHAQEVLLTSTILLKERLRLYNNNPYKLNNQHPKGILQENGICHFQIPISLSIFFYIIILSKVVGT